MLSYIRQDVWLTEYAELIYFVSMLPICVEGSVMVEKGHFNGRAYTQA